MPRIPVSAGVRDQKTHTTEVGSDGLTGRQRDVIRMFFVEGMKMSTISAALRYSVSTIEKEKAAALAILRKTEEEMRADQIEQHGEIYLRIAIERGGDVAFPLDTTVSEAHKALTVPGYREALRRPSLSARAVKEFHRKHPRSIYNVNEDPNYPDS